MQLFKVTANKLIAILNEEDEVVANFPDTDAGHFAYGCFLDGVVRRTDGPSVFDQDRGDYAVGTIDQLTS